MNAWPIEGSITQKEKYISIINLPVTDVMVANSFYFTMFLNVRKSETLHKSYSLFHTLMPSFMCFYLVYFFYFLSCSLKCSCKINFIYFVQVKKKTKNQKTQTAEKARCPIRT